MDELTALWLIPAATSNHIVTLCSYFLALLLSSL